MAVSDKYNTTDENYKGIMTDLETNSQIVFMDTPGVVKTSNSLRSNLLVSKAWENILDNDLAIFVVDSVKRLSTEVRGSLIRLSKTRVDPEYKKMADAFKDGTYSEEAHARGDYKLTNEERKRVDQSIPSVLVLNKVDLLTSKRRLRAL